LDKLSVAVIGATGAVGQRFIQLLADHPWFNLDYLAASSRSAGKSYSDAVSWGLIENMPESICAMPVNEISIDAMKAENIDLVFSALPTETANKVEAELAANGFKIFSNASANRMKEYVPLLIADINPKHLSLVEIQKKSKPGHGYIVTNPNCSVTGLATALKPITDSFGIESVTVSTYQALSGAGYPGVPAIDIEGNVLPYIPNEEDKVETECRKILGNISNDKISPIDLEVVASCVRVPVRDGHLESVVAELTTDVDIDELKNVFKSFYGLKDISLTEPIPSAPINPIIVMEEPDRPQPKLDIYSGSPERGRGMAINIGRIKVINKRKIRFFLLVHNTIRGAAGCSIMNAELAKSLGFI